MKYCPQCNRQYDEPWITFCSDDGSMLIEELSPAVDPNWDPRIRDPQTAPPSEQETQWLPRDAPMPPAWVAPDERPPMMSPVWQPPPPPRTRQQSQTLAIASMITGILGLVLGCFGAIPGIAGVVLGWMALAQIKRDPGTTGGKPMAIIGLVTGGITVAFNALFLLWIILAAVFGNL
ncbi:MAG TPA: DUF4190 domain-containing protein [Pyrinomonadaceae bacterium]|nr:DUF4190 domain-containing protein [Pyrinomonadaceae bacterium]